MPELEYFLAAESHSVDRDTNSISIFNVFTEIRAEQGLPFVIPHIRLISCWVSSEEEIALQGDNQASIVLHLPGENPKAPFNFHFKADTRFQHLVLGYHDLEIKNAGMLEFELLRVQSRFARVNC
jgi:hypothetical protein